MTLLNTIQQDQLQARKNKDELKTSLLTVLLSDAVNIGKNDGNRETTDAEVIALLKKFVKTNEQNIGFFKNENKQENIASAEQEIAILNTYLPRAASESDIVETIRTVMAQNNWPKENATMGKVMKELKAKFGAALDGATASKLIKAELQ